MPIVYRVEYKKNYVLELATSTDWLTRPVDAVKLLSLSSVLLFGDFFCLYFFFMALMSESCFGDCVGKV